MKMGFSGLIRTFLSLNWVLIFNVPCLDCFQFIKVTQNPINVVIGDNSTNVKLRWEFDLDISDQFVGFVIKRFKENQFIATQMEIASYYSSGPPRVKNDTLYALNASGVSPRGFASFSIKNILLQDPNGDGTTFDPFKSDVTYVYRIDITIPNLVPSVRSDTIKLQVKVPPTITTYVCEGCLNGSVIENQTVTFVCNATGKPTPNIKWMKNGKDYNHSGNKLLFQQVSRDDKGNYTCIAYNGVGDDSKAITLLVKYKPDAPLIFTPNPNECDNNSINFSCTAEAFPPVNNYSLYKGNTYFGSSTNGQFITPATPPGKITFCCVASNEIGSSQCGFADIYVLGVISPLCKINNETTSVTTVNEGEKVVLNCIISGNQSYYHYQWFKVKNSLQSHVSNKQSLPFDSINRTDEGYYLVTVRDIRNCSSQSRVFNITVNYKPENTRMWFSPDKKDFCEGNSTRVNCTADAKPDPVYSLYRNKEYLRGSENGIIFVTFNGEGDYTYTCEPNNTAGVGPNKSKNVTVKGPLNVWKCRINNETLNKGVVEMSTVDLRLTDSEIERLDFTWKNGTENIVGAVSQNLVIRRITRYQGGKYRVVARDMFNCSANMECDFTLDVHYPPGQPSILFSPSKSIVYEGEAINMTCKTDANPKPNYLWFFKGKMLQSEINDTISLSNIKPINAGNYKCIAVNYVGNSTTTKKLTVKYSPGQPKNFTANPAVVCKDEIFTLTCANADAYPDVDKYTLHDVSGNLSSNRNGYFVQNATTVGEKTFWCFPWNEVGRGKNVSTKVNVVEHPIVTDCKINDKPTTNKAVVNGTSVSLTCKYHGSSLTALWKPNSSRGSELSQNSSFMLKFDEILVEDEGDYRLVVKNGQNCSTDKDFHLDVHLRVHNFDGPNNVSVTEFEEFNVTCSADGKPLPTLTVVFPSGKTVHGTKALINTITAYRNMTGMYKCTAENEVTVPQNKSAWLNVWYLPNQPKNFTAKPLKVCKNGKVNLTCTNSEANPPVNNYTLHDANSFLEASTTGNFEVRATNTGEHTFWCFPSNDAGKGKSVSTKVIVFGPPIIALYKNNDVPLRESVDPVEDEAVIITFSYSGNLSVTWEKISGGQTSGQSFKDNVTYGLKFNSVDRSDNGTYRVTARDGNGCETEKLFTLSVRFLPNQPKNLTANPVTVCNNGRVNLACTNSEDDPPVNNYTLHDASGRFLKYSTTGYFEVRATTIGENTFLCFPWNDVGKGKNVSTKVNVVGRPNVTDCKINNEPTTNKAVVNGTSVNLTCKYHDSNLNASWEPERQRGVKISRNSLFTLKFDEVIVEDEGNFSLDVVDGHNCSTYKPFHLEVHSLPSIECNGTKILKPSGPYAEFEVTVKVHPKPEFFHLISKEKINAICHESKDDKYTWNCVLKIPKSISPPYIVYTENRAGTLIFVFGISNRSTEKKIYAFLEVKYKEMKHVPDVDPIIKAIIKEAYRCNPDVIDFSIIGYKPGSLYVNFQLTAITDMDNEDDYLQPLKTIIREKPSLLKGLTIDPNDIKSGFYESKTTTGLETVHIIIIVVAVLVVIGIIALILWYRKRKRPERKNSALMNNNGGDIPMNESGARDNEGFSPSHYAEKGPSHIEPAYDSVETRPKKEKDKNDDSAQPGMEQEEPAYAAVDTSKKTKNKNPGELLYADLGQFQPNGDKASGARGGIELIPIQQGQEVKRPEKYEDTIYAEIVGTKKPAADNQNAGPVSTDAPLGDVDGKDPESDEGAQKVDSGQTADPAKQQNEQKQASGATDKPPDTQEVQPPTKEDSGKEESESTENSVTKF